MVISSSSDCCVDSICIDVMCVLWSLMDVGGKEGSDSYCGVQVISDRGVHQIHFGDVVTYGFL